MANYPMNIWIVNENEFDEFTFTGGKVIYIVEEPDPKFATHPAIITAGALLPPFESIQFALDGGMFEANSIYEQYLQKEEADPFISIIIAAAFKRIPIGIMFGKDEMQQAFPNMLIDYFYRYFGIVFGVKNKIQPYIEEQAIPADLAKLYLMNIIDYQNFMEMHPDLPISPAVISKMAYEVRPAVKVKDLQSFTDYFELVKRAVRENNGKFLIDPLEGV